MLKNDNIQAISEPNDDITMDSVISRIKSHEKMPCLFSNLLKKEINFISSNFYKLDKSYKADIQKFSLNTIEKIFMNPKLVIRSEDQIISIINELYLKDKAYSTLYEHVLFINVSPIKMKIFLQNFDFSDLTGGIWSRLSDRMSEQVFVEDSGKFPHRYNMNITNYIDLTNNQNF